MRALKNTKENRIDLMILICWTILVTFLALVVFKTGKPYILTFFYWVVPTFYLFWRYKLSIKKVLLGSLLIGFVIPLPFDFLSNFNEAWFIPAKALWIPIKLFNVLPIDELIWFFFLALYTITFYEAFVDDGRVLRISKNFFKALIFYFSVSILVFFFFFIFRNSLTVPFPYLTIVMFFSFPPIIYLLRKRPEFMGKFSFAMAFFFFVALNFEVTAVSLGHWGFQGEYIGTVTLFGQTFPFEEFFYWILLYPATAISYYELFVDDEK